MFKKNVRSKRLRDFKTYHMSFVRCQKSDVNSPKIKRFQMSDVKSTSNKDKVSDGANNEETQKTNIHSEDPRMIHQRNQSSNLCKKLLSYLCTFQRYIRRFTKSKKYIEDFSEGCLAAILKVRICHSRNMKFTSSTFIFRGGLLGNNCFYRWYLMFLPSIEDSTDCA